MQGRRAASREQIFAKFYANRKAALNVIGISADCITMLELWIDVSGSRCLANLPVALDKNADDLKVARTFFPCVYARH